MLRKFLSLKGVLNVKNFTVSELPMNLRFGKQLLSSKVLCPLNFGVMGVTQVSRNLHFSSPRKKVEDRRGMLASMPTKDEGTEGERTVDIDTLIKSGDSLFPDENTPDQLFNGVPFRELPICNVRVSSNNTIITITDYKGAVKLLRSCGLEGFKNTRKGTNVAAQATAISLSTMALDKGFKTVRVRVRGLGPGRMSAVKGLQMGGLDIVSITDSTPVSWNPPRPRKQRKL